MAVVVNRSDAALEMFGVRSGTDERAILPPGKQSADDFDVLAVRAPEDDFTKVFEEDHWWAILTDEAHVYEYSDWTWLINTNLTLHCIPPRPGAHGFAPGYQIPSDTLQTAIDATDLDPDLIRHRDPANAQDAKDNELDSEHALFGKFVRTRNFISVRLELVPHAGVDPATLNDQKRTWKETIEQVWNASAVPSSSTGVKYVFECDWTQQSEHYSVDIYQSIPWRASMFMWPVDLDRHVSAHEYGHYLGLADSYLYDGELPHLKSTIAKLPKFKHRAETMKTVYSLWTNLASLWPSNSERAQDRETNGQWTGGQVDMMWRSKLSPTVPNTKITTNLIDTIERVGDADFDTQDLFWRERDFEFKESGGALAFIDHEDH